MRLKRNVTFFRRHIGVETKLLAVVKSNAYGHGLVDFSKQAVALGVDWLGVDSVVEALKLRKNGVRKPILILGYTLPERYREAAKAKVRITVSTLEGIRIAKECGAVFHLKVDTGMHRQGFLPKDFAKALSELARLQIPRRQFEGLYTHLAAPGNDKFRQETEVQLAAFREISELVRKAGYRPLTHASATLGSLRFPEEHFDMVRVGMGLYGFLPDGHRNHSFSRIQPILSWRTRISELKRLPKGEAVGYDFTHRLLRDSTLAICPVGYWHGLPRVLSNTGSVLILGKRAPIVGRVSMDMIMADITDIPSARVGSVVTIIGSSGKERIEVEEIARLAGTSGYEIITRLNPLMKKFYT